MSSDRRDDLLRAALTVFSRYGYRKTSMDEIARAAQMSRPGLYLYYNAKDVLFRGAVQHHLDNALWEATAKLHDTGPLSERIVAALDSWLGRYVGSETAVDIGEIVEHSEAQLGTLFAEYRTTFVTALGKNLPRHHGVKPADTAATLYATADGWRPHVQSRTEFAKKLTIAARLIFGP